MSLTKPTKNHKGIFSNSPKKGFTAREVFSVRQLYSFVVLCGLCGRQFIRYATGDNPYGPFTYQGVILNPVIGWTNHHSIVEFRGRWYLFYHDSSLSGGKTHLHSVKVTELKYNPDGTIQTIDAYKK